MANCIIGKFIVLFTVKVIYRNKSYWRLFSCDHAFQVVRQILLSHLLQEWEERHQLGALVGRRASGFTLMGGMEMNQKKMMMIDM